MLGIGEIIRQRCQGCLQTLTRETVNADVTDKGRKGQKQVGWERHDEFNYRQAICGCNDIQRSAVQQTL